MDWLRRLRLSHDYRAVFGSAAGERVLADLVREAQFDRSLLGSDPLVAAHFDGRRHMGIRILEMLRQPVTDHIPTNRENDDGEG